MIKSKKPVLHKQASFRGNFKIQLQYEIVALKYPFSSKSYLINKQLQLVKKSRK